MQILPAVLYIVQIFFVKKSYLVFGLTSSFIISFSISETILKEVNQIDIAHSVIPILASLIFVFLICTFILCDMVTGIIASKHENNKITSDAWGRTISKFIGIIFYECLVALAIVMTCSNYVILTILFTPFVLKLLKEYISIGENIQRRFGEKPYIFSLADVFFEKIEITFFERLDKYFKNEKNN